MIDPNDSEGIFFRNSQQAFEEAIARGRLSLDRASETWEGHYMYVGTLGAGSQDLFKHIWTRTYLPMQPAHAEAS